MKILITIIFANFLLIISGCKNPTETKNALNTSATIKEVTENENKLFSLLKEGKINDAFAMHKNNSSYKNIVEGTIRTYVQMDSILKDYASKNIKAYDYNVVYRDFLIVDNINVLETIEGNRKLINKTDSVIEIQPLTLSILWTKDSAKWEVSYLHGSYKMEK